MSEHPSVLVELARLRVRCVEEPGALQRPRLRVWAGLEPGASPGEVAWVSRQMMEDKEQMEALAR